MQLKPQDFLVALKLVAWADQRWTYARLAHELGVSASEAHACVKRGLQAQLLVNNPVWASAAATSAAALQEPAAVYRVRARPQRARRVAAVPGFVSDLGPPVDDNPVRVHAQNLAEFAVHGAKYAFPAQLLPGSLGVPTGRGAPVLAHWTGAGEGAWVWPHPHGEVQGQGLEPLHPSAPYAAMQDAGLYQMLALFDVLRVGGASDQTKASQRLRRRIDPDAGAAGQEAPGV